MAQIPAKNARMFDFLHFGHSGNCKTCAKVPANSMICREMRSEKRRIIRCA
jgi:hypothetical protein